MKKDRSPPEATLQLTPVKTIVKLFKVIDYEN